MTQAQRRLFLIQSLLKEKTEYRDIDIPAEPESQRQLLRGLMNIRAPQSIGADFLQVQDDYLKTETAAKGITDSADLTPVQPGLYLWQGDITTLKCDAIVNAANFGMTGCYVPNHRCIDNAIHTFSGVELRLACEKLMEQQGFPEPTGQAKITPAFNLPCRYVLHTVGPIISGRVTKADKELLVAKHGDSYDIFYDGSILQNYGAPIEDVRSDATLQLFATDVGENVLLEKTSGTIEVLRVYDSALTRDECFKLYRELQTPW